MNGYVIRVILPKMTHESWRECQTVRFFVVFFPDILFQQMVFVVGLGFVVWISWDPLMDKQNRWLIVDS